MDIVDKIDRLLKDRGISAAQLCRELGFSSGLYSQWRKRSQKPSAEKLRKIAAYFGVSLDYLMDRTPGPGDAADDIRIALYHETEGMSDETLDRVLQFARFARIEEKKRKDKAAREKAGAEESEHLEP
ncbi:MAG: helix-turn-helix domain-containing protein [Oscillospiraceae bacterium]|nr:helix-turn-helix domain-containing protein [Oscillospiraceae bacterium]